MAANFFMWLRMIGFYRLFETTAHYIIMIKLVLVAILGFIVIVVTFITSFAFGLIALRTEDHMKLSRHWIIAFRLGMGDFEEEYAGDAERTLFFIASFTVTILLLNLLIAILSEEFEKVQNKKEVYMTLAKVSLTLEITNVLRKFNRESLPRFMHFCKPE